MTTTIPCRAKDPHTCRYHSALIRAEEALAKGELDTYLAESSAATEAAKTDRDVKAFFARQAKIPTDVATLKPATLAGVKKTDSPVEALAKLKARDDELDGLTGPAKQEQKLLWEQIKEQTTRRWQQEPPHDYIGDDDAAGFYELMNDSWNNTGAHDYKRAYLKSLLGEYARSDGYNSTTMLPSIEASLPYIPDEDKLSHLSEGLTRYAKFATDHEDEWAAQRGSTPLGNHYWKEYKSEGHRYIMITMNDISSHEAGIPQVRIYADGTAVRCFLRHGTTYAWKTTNYGGTVGYNEDINAQERRPLIDVLRESSKDWYYPAESKPGYQERSYDEDDSSSLYDSYDY